MADWSHLSPSEYEKISSVLKRDRELRSVEEARIRQLKQELLCLRKRAALRPGLDPLRNCARCLNELGRIINRGALCPLCFKKVCKACRHYDDENYQWLCVYCYKQMQLKAISGEWMQELSQLSVRAKDPPGDQLRKVLHASQRKGLLDYEVAERNRSSIVAEIPPEKPPRSFQHERSHDNEVHESQIEVLDAKGTTDMDANSSPPVLPTVSPWNGIDPEPTIPLRVDKSRSFGSVQQYDSSEQFSYRERQSSDEGHCTIGYRSRSTSSEVLDDLAPVSRKRLSPLKKQQAIPDPSPIENHQSSVDSGVSSPGLKLDNSSAPPSPLAPTECPSSPLDNCESSSSEGEKCQPPTASLFRKVTLKKRKCSSGPKTLKGKRCGEVNPVAPPLGLTYSLFYNNTKSYCKTNSKRKLTRFLTNVSGNCKIKTSAVTSSLKPKVKNKGMLIFSNSHDACVGSSLPNTEALCDGPQKGVKVDGNQKEPTNDEIRVLPFQKRLSFSGQVRRCRRDYRLPSPDFKKGHSLSRNNNCNGKGLKRTVESKVSLHSSFLPKQIQEKCSKHNDQNQAHTNKLSDSRNFSVLCNEYKNFEKFQKTPLQPHNEYPDMLVRSASLPNRRTFTYDWLQSWLWKCHSLEDWFWYLEEQPYETRNFSQINILPDDYKLVYVSSSSNSSDSDECSSRVQNLPMKHLHQHNFRLGVKDDLKIYSGIKINCRTSYLDDSEWELESVDSDDSDFTVNRRHKTLFQVNEGNNFIVHRNLHADKKWEQEQHCSSKVKKSRCRSPDSVVVGNKFLHQELPITKPNLKNSKISLNFDYFKLFSKASNPLPCNNSSKLNPFYPLSVYHFMRLLNSFPFHGITKRTIKCDYIKTFTAAVGINASLCLPTCTDLPFQIHSRFNNKIKFRTSNLISYSLQDFAKCFLSLVHSLTLDIENEQMPDVFWDISFWKNSHVLSCCEPFNTCVWLYDYIDWFRNLTEVQNFFATYLFESKLPICQRRNISKRILIGAVKRLTVRLDDRNYDLNPTFECYSHPKVESLIFLLSLTALKLSVKRFKKVCCFDSNLSPNAFAESFQTNKDVSISTINSIVLTLHQKYRNYSTNHFHSLISTTCSEESFFSSHLIFSENKSSDLVQCDQFYNSPDGEVGNALHPGDANAFHFHSAADVTNRGNDMSATGWGKKRRSIAVPRVIDLRPLKCGREVLEVADLIAFLGWSAKHGDKVNTENAFFYHALPVAPEVDYLLRLTRLDPCLLLQRTQHESGGVCMIAIKSEDTAVLQKDNVCKFFVDETRKEVDALPLSEYMQNIPQCSELVSHASRLGATLTTDKVEKSALDACGKNVNKLDPSFKSEDSTTIYRYNFKGSSKYLQKYNYNSLEANFNPNEVLAVEGIVKEWDSEVLPFVRNLFCKEFLHESSAVGTYNFTVSSEICDDFGIIERVDCQCNKPCDVPSSPSVVDATLDVQTFAEDGEGLSSGDELDKLESDTDSQDTVIEGEAYKRIRSVAIKEKILHANEELFGVNFKDICCSHESNKFINVEMSERNSKTQFDINEITRKTFQSLFLKDQQNDIPKYLCSNLLETKPFEKYLSNVKHFQPFKTTDQSAFIPISPSSFIEKKSEVGSSDCRNILSELSQSSSYKTSFCENICSSESSDNGSDGEEIILSDTSTSSDEAVYIAPSSGFRYHSRPLSYRLHTIVEESCEESSRGATPTSRANSEFEYYDMAQIASVKNPKKVLRKSVADNTILGHEKSSTTYAVLATSRLEKYFQSGLLEGEFPYPEDDLTDESGGISSDDETTNIHLKDKLRDESSNGQIPSEKFNKKAMLDKSNLSLKMLFNGSSDSNARKRCSSESEKFKPSFERKRNYFISSSCNKTNYRTEPSPDLKFSRNTEPVSDDDAKYIMGHLMQHISNNTEIKTEIHPEVKDVSPMLKILESEIARLMLTVSPASLSAGEPSSSCSSTIGSNNSDYGSDTLESAEESTSDEEINAEDLPENRALMDLAPQIEPVSIIDNFEASSVDNESPEAYQVSDSVVSEETLYICKQLMASLKKIADATEGTVASDEFCSNSEDHSAKQYITDQIVSLMQTVSASHNSPLLRTLTSNPSPTIQLDSDVSQDRSDSDSPPLNDEKRERDLPKSKTPSESGSETTISASISIPSYDDSDRTPTESEISHEMDELYALLENNGAHQDIISAKFSYELDTVSHEKVELRNMDSPLSEGVSTSSSDSCDINHTVSKSHSSLLSGAASKLESLLPITIEERIARYKKAFMTKTDEKESDYKVNETRINVILPQPSMSDIKHVDDLSIIRDSELPCFNPTLKAGESCDTMPYSSNIGKNDESYNITSVKIISHNTYPLSSAIHKILSSNIDSKYLEQKLDYQIVNILDTSTDDKSSLMEELQEDNESNVMPVPKIINPKEKASSENDLLVANYRAKSKGTTVFGTKSVGNISELENTNSKSAFRDTGYYSFKSSEESFLSLDDSTASQTSTASLTQYRSLTSTETIPEEEESSVKMSLSSSNIPDAVCDASPSKSSTLPLSLRSKLPGANHRSRSSFFSTSGVLRKLTQLRDESGNSLRSSPHGRLRMRNRSLSGGSEDGKQRKTSVPQISVSECPETQVGRSSAASSEKDSSGVQEDEIDQAFAYHCRSQMSLSSFGGRSESVTSVYSAAGGGRYGTVTVTGEVLFGLIYNYKAGTLEINIKECRNLAAVDTKRNRSDPYVKVYLLPDRTKSGKRKTKVKKHTLNPIFDECLKFHVTIHELVIRSLWLSVWHSDRFGRNDFLGEVMLPLGNDTIETSSSKWYPLQERLETVDSPVSYKGDLILALKYVPPDVTSRKFSKKPGVLVKGTLEVLVREARNLMATRSNGTSDPFCKSYLLPDKSKSGKQKTPVLKKSCNPKWNHTFVYGDVSLDDLRERCLELTIWDYDKITSNDFLGGVRLCLGTGKYQGRDVDWMDSIGEERSLWYTMLERPNTWVDGSLLLRPNMQSRRIF